LGKNLQFLVVASGLEIVSCSIQLIPPFTYKGALCGFIVVPIPTCSLELIVMAVALADETIPVTPTPVRLEPSRAGRAPDKFPEVKEVSAEPSSAGRAPEDGSEATVMPDN
jgi:hypothetical protein